jgi:hypothetical protein
MRRLGTDTLITWVCAALAIAFPAYWIAAGIDSYVLILVGWSSAAVGAVWGFRVADESTYPLDRSVSRMGAFVSLVAGAASAALVIFVVANLGGS